MNRATQVLRSGIAAAFVVAWIVAGPAASAQTADPDRPISLVTFPFGDLSSTENDQAAGPAVRILAELGKAASLPGTVDMIPLARLRQMLGEGRTIATFLARIPEREGQYQWVVKLFNERLVFATYRHPAVNSLAEAHALGSIGVTDDGMPRKVLEAAGFTQLQPVPLSRTNLAKLMNARIDAWCASFSVVRGEVAALGLASNEITIGAPVARAEFWVAASLDVPEDVIDRMRRRFAELKADGTYDRIMPLSVR